MGLVAKKQTWGGVIREELAAVKSGRHDLRKFGVTMAIAFVVLGFLFLWRDKGTVAVVLFVLAALFLLFGAAVPTALRPIQKGWMAFAIVLGWLMTRVILVIVFFVGITPIALIARLSGKRFLELGFDAKATTYWHRRPAPDRGKERYESQF
jgi:hypothetical protein